MTPILLAGQAAIWLIVCYIFASGRASSIFHPFAFYLAFHGIVFVLRPILVYTFGLEAVFFAMRFYPTAEEFNFTLLLSTAAMLVFGVATWRAQGPPPRFDRGARTGFSRSERHAFAFVVVLLAPLAMYSVLIGIQSTLETDAVGTLIEMERDVNTGVIGFSNTTGYIVDAQLVIGPLSLMLIWAYRFRPWSFLPLLAYLAERAYMGWGRWTIVLTLMMLGLLFLSTRKLRWIPVYMMAAALPVLIVFQQLGEHRGTFQALITGEVIDEDPANAGRGWIERHDSPDFANFDFLTYVVDVVPAKSGTYSYFTQYLQLFTEPIPRMLWPDKPYGPPIQLVNLNDFGNFVGWTTSLVGDGWISGGWLGVILTMTVVAWLTMRMHRWFWSGAATNFKVLVYCTFLPLTLQWYRDGGISIAKFVFLTIGPLLLWRLVAQMLERRPAAGRRLWRPGHASARASLASSVRRSSDTP
jgi:hypothetical protein